jgi:Tol biopolymer transport system component
MALKALLHLLCGVAAAWIATLPGQADSRLTTVRQRDAAAANGPYWRDGWRGGTARADVSSDGRYVALESRLPLRPDDTNHHVDIYVLDRKTGSLTIETLAENGRASNTDSWHPRISGEGRFVAFRSIACRLIAPACEEPQGEILLRDRQAGSLRRLSNSTSGERANRDSDRPDISADGGVVAFESAATNLVMGLDANGSETDVYLVESTGGPITRVSVDSRGLQASNGNSFAPSLAGDGRLVAFTSKADLVCNGVAAPEPCDRNHLADVYVRDTRLGVTTLVSRALGGDANGASFHPALSADGRFVVFVSDATNLGPRDRNHAPDVYLYDLQRATTTLVSRRAGSHEAANGESRFPAISADGRVIAFASDASDLVCSRRCRPDERDENLLQDIYRFDVTTGAMTRVSAGPPGEAWWGPSFGASLDGSGHVVAFSSRHPVSADDVADDFDLFIWALWWTKRR